MSHPNFIFSKSLYQLTNHICLIFVQPTFMNLAKAPTPISLSAKLQYFYTNNIFKEISTVSLRDDIFLQSQYDFYLYTYMFT
jgi:hypothetical protein